MTNRSTSTLHFGLVTIRCQSNPKGSVLRENETAGHSSKGKQLARVTPRAEGVSSLFVCGGFCSRISCAYQQMAHSRSNVPEKSFCVMDCGQHQLQQSLLQHRKSTTSFVGVVQTATQCALSCTPPGLRRPAEQSLVFPHKVASVPAATSGRPGATFSMPCPPV
ncbi:hypothetical protein AOLI_G00037520 [Acnodon oligacanthus]